MWRRRSVCRLGATHIVLRISIPDGGEDSVSGSCARRGLRDDLGRDVGKRSRTPTPGVAPLVRSKAPGGLAAARSERAAALPAHMQVNERAPWISESSWHRPPMRDGTIRRAGPVTARMTVRLKGYVNATGPIGFRSRIVNAWRTTEQNEVRRLPVRSSTAPRARACRRRYSREVFASAIQLLVDKNRLVLGASRPSCTLRGRGRAPLIRWPRWQPGHRLLGSIAARIRRGPTPTTLRPDRERLSAGRKLFLRQV